MTRPTSTVQGVLTAGFRHRARVREWLFENRIKFNESRRFLHSTFYVSMTYDQQMRFCTEFANVLN